MIQEYWKIVEANTNYEVSTSGRVRRIGGRIKKSGRNNNGYLSCALFDPSRKCKVQNLLVHRMMAVAFIPNPHKKRCVNHIDGDKTNNVIENLEWNTHSENNFHSVRMELRPRCLSRNAIIEIAKLINQGVPKPKIATMYSVNLTTIYRRVLKLNSSLSEKNIK